MPTLGGRAAGSGLLLRADDFLAQNLQLGVADLVQFHAQIENGDRHQLGRLVPPALAKNGTALLEHFKHRKQMFV